ncbi:MAG: hypothetical protein LJE75_00745 [Gammaproteobacteria bacterium]|jgi:hypothetical protein|nr:hypothetical protein [Gammaproteobacteria bacterium]
MSDITQILQLHGAQLASIEQGEDDITLHFSQVQLVQEMENAIEDSLWTQALDLSLKGIEIEGELPQCPCEIKGGDLTDNIFTYRDHAPLPISWRGTVACKLCVAGSNACFSISGDSLKVDQIAHPRYIKHIKKG